VRRSEQRRAAVFALYQAEVTGKPLADALGRDAAAFTRALAYATDDHREELDPVIAKHLENWSLDRLAPLERALLRVAVLELRHPDLAGGEKPIPPEGAISEAVETAKKYCGAGAPALVNGVLAAALRDQQNAAA
jgi:N utilization substance protein B